MFISRRSHEAIVAVLKAQLADKDEQIADLKEDRDFYRSAWTAKQGERFTSDTGVSQGTIESRSEELPARLDAHWSPDDRDVFLTWAKDRFPAAMNELELLEMWRRNYGETNPVAIAIAGRFRE